MAKRSAALGRSGSAEAVESADAALAALLGGAPALRPREATPPAVSGVAPLPSTPGSERIGAPRPRTPKQQARAVARSQTAAAHGRYLVEEMPADEQAKWDALAPSAIGRPSKLNADRTAAIVEALRLGTPLMAATGAAGIAAGTLQAWIAQGEVDMANGRDTAHARFATSVRIAEMATVQKCLRDLQDARANDWQRWAWMLERRWPEWFARRDAVSVGISGKVEVELRYVDDWHTRDVIDVPTPEPQAQRRNARERELDGQPAAR